MPQTGESEALMAAVETAYKVFAGYRPGHQLATCRCPMCMDDYTEEELLNTPLREIDCRLLSEYTWSANGTNNPKYDPNELRYFLPRYFELIASGECPCFNADEPTLRQLGVISYRAGWPNHEVEAVDRFFTALLKAKLEKPPFWHRTEFGNDIAISDVEDTMCVIAYGDGDIAALLLIWENNASQSADAHLACLSKHCNDDSEYAHGLWSAFWRGQERHAELIAVWVRRPETVHRLERALTRCSIKLEADLFEEAIHVVKGLIDSKKK